MPAGSLVVVAVHGRHGAVGDAEVMWGVVVSERDDANEPQAADARDRARI